MATDAARRAPPASAAGFTPASAAGFTPASAAGFTIVELLVAMGILLFGTVSLLGVLGVGVSTHRSAEQHNFAVQLAQRVLQRLEEDVVPRALLAAAEMAEAGGDPEELKLSPIDSTPADVVGLPGLRYRVEFQHDPARPNLLLATVRVLWLEQGEAQAVDFERILVSHVPFSQRVARLQEGRR